MQTCSHKGQFMSAPLGPLQSELAYICLFFFQFNNQLDVKHHKVIVL